MPNSTSRLLLIVLAGLAFDSRSLHADEQHLVPIATAGSGGAVSTALSRVELDVMQRTIAPSAFKGAFDETHMNRYLTK